MNPVIILWNTAVFMASVFAAAIVSCTLKPKFNKKITGLLWGAFGLGGYLLSLLSYSMDLYNDFVGILAVSALVCVATEVIYTESRSAKLFTSVMAALIANVVTFMFCGTTDTFLGTALGFIETTPYTVKNVLLFIGIKLVVYLLFFAFYYCWLRGKVQAVIEAQQGRMNSYIAAPLVSMVGFYVLNLISNNTGIMPGNPYFFPLYITVCVIFVLEYVQIFTSVFWSARAMKNEAELNVASSIQKNMLPCIFPAFPEHDEFDIYATMTPAKEVGGDFYDFFLLDDDHLVMVIADVSDKGVPAALFMVIAKTLLKNCAQSGDSPKEILEKVNNQLCENNDAEMFVTVWLGKIQLSTGKMVCANAGHEYPVIRHGNGEYQLFHDKHGFVLAGMENARYREYELTLEPGDKLFVYTDGVTEATNSARVLYGTDRMLRALNRAADSSPEATLTLVKADIDGFVGNAPQFDDITMLSFEMKRVKHAVKRLEVEPDLKNLEAVTALAEEQLTAKGAPFKVISQINIAIDEIFSNIVRYGRATRIRVECVMEDSRITLRFADDGTPYDPTKTRDPDISLSAEERDFGGLGIYMVKKTMDALRYEFKNEKNVLTLEKSW